MAFLKYFPLVKVDESAHTISGIATAEVPDKDGEICDYDAAKKAYKAWSKEAADSTKSAGQDISYGNIRLQHTLEIGGKVCAPVVFDDDSKSVHIDTEPENDGIFTKAKKGFIRGFSQGGDYAWRKCNECRTDIAEGNECPKCKKAVFIRYAPVISEVSYVDNPCVKAATFTLVKADGTSEAKPFTDEPAALRVAKTHTTEGSSPVEQTQPAGTPASPTIDVNAIAEQVTKSVLATLGKSVKHLVTDGKEKHLPYTDEDGTPNHRLMGAAWAALHGGYRGKKYEGPDKDKAVERLKAVYEKEGLDTPDEKAKKVIVGVLDKAAEKKGFKKGLYEVSRFADLLQSLAYLRMSAIYERDQEDDDSAIPEDLLADLEGLAETFLAMAEEETKELTAIAGGKGHNKMSNNSALAKATKTLAEHVEKAKKAVTEHCDKMCKAHEDHKAALHESLDKLHKLFGANESDELEGSKTGSHEPEPIDPQKEGTPNHLSAKAAGETFTKADVEKAASDAANAAVQAVLKALASDEEEEDEAEPKKKEAKKAASGIGDRGNMPAIVSNGGPAIRVTPVTKAQDAQAVATAAATNDQPLTKAEISAALAGDPTAALKFMKSAVPQTSVPATVAAVLSKRS